MKFKKIRLEEDYETSEDVSPGLIGETEGCSCCVERIPITRENLREYIEDLRAELIFARDLLKNSFGEINE